MKKYILALLLISVTLSACRGSYEDGYAEGYRDGYRDALSSVSEAPSTVPTLYSTTDPTNGPEPHLTLHQHPENGHFFNLPPVDMVAPFEVRTEGSGGYYLILDPIRFYDDAKPGSFEFISNKLWAETDEIRFYARAGAKVEVLIPLGEYEIYYATGEYWYGESFLFGTETKYYKCDKTFVFKEESGNYTGWTLELMPVVGGNLDTDLIDASEFPK